MEGCPQNKIIIKQLKWNDPISRDVWLFVAACTVVLSIIYNPTERWQLGQRESQSSKSLLIADLCSITLIDTYSMIAHSKSFRLVTLGVRLISEVGFVGAFLVGALSFSDVMDN